MTSVDVRAPTEIPTDRVNILVVDDQPDGRFALAALLSRLGQNVVTAASGRDALRHLLTDEFAVILLDVQMPEMDGYETAALVREKIQHIPIIFLTASHEARVEVMRGYAAGAVDFMFKPIDPEILVSKVAVFVELALKSRLVTRQREALAQREREARDLAETRALLLTDLERKHRELEIANRELEAFSYSVSHDLRAPLRAIAGFSAALAEDQGDRLDDAGRHNLEKVREAARRMSQLIEDLLGLAKTSRAELRRAAVDLSQLAREVVDRIRTASQASEARDVEITVQEGLIADGDARLLRVVLENLLGNAWKFTGKRPRAHIAFGATARDGQTVYFVRDDGAGFDPAYASKLFGAFQRLHKPTDFEGTGVGLATVQRIIHRHGGEIWADSRPDEGATFSFTLG